MRLFLTPAPAIIYPTTAHLHTYYTPCSGSRSLPGICVGFSDIAGLAQKISRRPPPPPRPCHSLRVRDAALHYVDILLLLTIKYSLTAPFRRLRSHIPVTFALGTLSSLTATAQRLPVLLNSLWRMGRWSFTVGIAPWTRAQRPLSTRPVTGEASFLTTTQVTVKSLLPAAARQQKPPRVRPEVPRFVSGLFQGSSFLLRVAARRRSTRTTSASTVPVTSTVIPFAP